ncbi:hypothetical protein [Methanosarcina horonobensis]|nr:hypothetical protein [Methanosarcina horonobensis]
MSSSEIKGVKFQIPCPCHPCGRPDTRLYEYRKFVAVPISWLAEVVIARKFHLIVIATTLNCP